MPQACGQGPPAVVGSHPAVATSSVISAAAAAAVAAFETRLLRSTCSIDLPECPRFFEDLETHIGTHGESLRAMLRHPGSRQHVAAAFEKVKAYLRPRQADGMTEFHIVVFCKSGKHTSVSLAVLLDYVLSQAGYGTRVEHLCRAKWSLWSCGRTYSCQQCDDSRSSKTEGRRWAEANAWTMWLNDSEPRICIPRRR